MREKKKEGGRDRRREKKERTREGGRKRGEERER